MSGMRACRWRSVSETIRYVARDSPMIAGRICCLISDQDQLLSLMIHTVPTDWGNRLQPLLIKGGMTRPNQQPTLQVISKFRTSVDHGTALDLAGTGQANPDSLQRAIEVAISMSSEGLASN